MNKSNKKKPKPKSKQSQSQSYNIYSNSIINGINNSISSNDWSDPISPIPFAQEINRSNMNNFINPLNDTMTVHFIFIR